MKKTIVFVTLLMLLLCRVSFAQVASELENLKAKYEADKRNVKAATEYVNALQNAKQMKEAEAVAREYMSRCPVVQLQDKDTYLLITPYVFEDVYSNAFEYGISLIKKACWERDEVAANSKQPQWERRLRALQKGVSGDGEIDKRYELMALLSKNLNKEIKRHCDPVRQGKKYLLPEYDAEKIAHLKKLLNRGELLGKEGMMVKLRVVEAMQHQQFRQVVREVCVGAELDLTGIRGGYMIDMLNVMLDYPLGKEELKEAIETVEGFVKRETERGMGLNYYTILGRLYEKNGEQEQAEKYIRLGEELEAERMERYKKMMNL